MSLNVLSSIPHWIAWGAEKFYEAAFLSSQFNSYSSLTSSPHVQFWLRPTILSLWITISIPSDLMNVLMCTNNLDHQADKGILRTSHSSSDPYDIYTKTSTTNTNLTH